MTDIPSRELELTADLVRQRLEELGCTATFCYSVKDIWLEEDGRRFSYWRWRNWFVPRLDTREDRAAEVVRMLMRPDEVV